jgi:hypothetical protein
MEWADAAALCALDNARLGPTKALAGLQQRRLVDYSPCAGIMFKLGSACFTAYESTAHRVSSRLDGVGT